MRFTVRTMSAPQIREFHSEYVPALGSKLEYMWVYECLDDQSARWPFQRHMKCKNRNAFARFCTDNRRKNQAADSRPHRLDKKEHYMVLAADRFESVQVRILSVGN